MLSAGAVYVDAADRTNQGNRFKRAARLLAGPQQAERRCIFPRNPIDCDTGRRADPHAGQVEFV